jgi:hypothetical protein
MQRHTVAMAKNLVPRAYQFKGASTYFRSYFLRRGVDDLLPEDP